MSNVSRGVYQKVKEENKKLINDIRILVFPEGDNWKPVLKKWRQKFQQDDEFTRMLQDVCREYLKEHPEYDIKKRVEEQNKAKDL